MKLLIISDIHASIDKLQKLSEKERAADLLLLAGDLTHFGGRKDALSVVEILRSFKIPVLAIHGNCDRPGVMDLLAEEGIFAHGKLVTVAGVPVIGLGGSLPAPIPTPSTYSEEEAASELEGLPDGIEGREWILLVHQPPADSEADRVAAGKHVGSTSVAEFIRNYRPSLVCTGHIHESCSVSSFGESLLVNPGSLKDGRYAVADFGDGKVSAELRHL
ncbi:hypothetical protein B4O97_10640 [Marispirochaeta aestuarii]|uniref:Calcineurin-like phosphoesterase domain-containing protein n=1 Tax=Marispirochaeta aestuarii TaxID=1963862 RepID=A0A1Y1RXS1_9SPIO|nr:metallophosphoesterase family protein [Marispirochaeta aestuarii]ORC35174.1 hypothetical protein B4O97_10640 [Marispirochaeta aestuarii]